MTETEVLINQIGPLSYFGIWWISLISNVIIPVPEEVVLLVLGYLAGGPKLNIFILFPIVFSGLLASDIVMYFLSRRKNKLVNLFYDKVFAARLEKRRGWLERHMGKVIFFSRFLIQLRFLGPFLAGQTGVGWRKFILIDSFAVAIYTCIYLSVGFYFRSRIDFIVSGVGIARNVVIIIILFALLLSLTKYVRKLILNNSNKSNGSTNEKSAGN